MDQPRRNDLLGVQALRAVAALMVVAYHAVDQWTTRMPGYAPGDYWPNGSAGVDVFFVISGLVMTISVQRNAGRPHAAWTFSTDRLIRILPLYWIITTVKIAAVFAAPGLAMRTTLDPLYVAGSYALLPVRDAMGIIRPVLPVGWTLTYEIMFYTLVALSLSMRVPMVRICVPALLGFAAFAFVLPAEGFANTIVIEFIFGMAIGSAVPRLQSLPPAIGVSIGLLALVLLVAMPVGDGLARPLTWGLPAACVVAAAVSAEAALRHHIPRWLLAAGNASYATYLTHGFLIPVVFVLIRSVIVDWAGFSDHAGLVITIVISLVAGAVAGQVTHLIVEQPLLLRLRITRPVSTMPSPG